MATLQSRDAWMVEGLHLALDHRDAQTKARCLYATLRGWIQNAELSVGMRLPSSRALAYELGISRNTALAAIDHLAAEGFIEAREGAGMYVAALQFLKPPPKAAPNRDSSAARLSDRGHALLSFCTETNLESRAFTPGVPALDVFPYAQWQRFLRRHRQRVCAVAIDSAKPRSVALWRLRWRPALCYPKAMPACIWSPASNP